MPGPEPVLALPGHINKDFCQVLPDMHSCPENCNNNSKGPIMQMRF